MTRSILRFMRWRVYPLIIPLLTNYVYTCRCGLAKGLKKKGGLGFIPIFQLTEEQRFLTFLSLKGKTVFDIGAAYGDLTLFFARAVGAMGRVIAFEPNPKLCNLIDSNVRLNDFDNVKILQIAVGKQNKRELLAFPLRELGIGSMEKHERSRILRLRGAKAIEVDVDSVDNLIATGKLKKPDFVKIDVQGLELDVLTGMKQTIQENKPKILVEAHYIPSVDWKTENLPKLAKFLLENDYSLYHIESGKKVSSHNLQIVQEGDHLYAD